MATKRDTGSRVFQIWGYLTISIISLCCVLPFLLVISASFTDEGSIIRSGYHLIPKVFSVKAYEYVFRSPVFILQAYMVTISLVVIGTTLHLLINSMAAYAISRQDFRYRNYVAFYLYFTTIFAGGLVPWYILCVRYLQLQDTYTILLISNVVSVFYLLLMRNFMKNIPESIIESAKMDGAGEFRIYWDLILPLSLPSVVTIGLLIGLAYWNEWYMARLFISNHKLYPLQYLLYQIINSAEYINMAIARGARISSIQAPRESIKMATAVIVTGPIIFVYPFLQKYFVKGLTIGAIKG